MYGPLKISQLNQTTNLMHLIKRGTLLLETRMLPLSLIKSNKCEPNIMHHPSQYNYCLYLIVNYSFIIFAISSNTLWSNE